MALNFSKLFELQGAAAAKLPLDMHAKPDMLFENFTLSVQWPIIIIMISHWTDSAKFVKQQTF